jgi:hypothetical protein
MFSWTRLLCAAAALALLGGLATVQAAPARRQYYDKKWSYNSKPKAPYHYRTYHYKPRSSYKGYKTQYVVYRPKKTKDWVYWYNPEKKRYWARCPTQYHKTYGADIKKGKDYWSLLPNEKKKEYLDDVKEDDWGKVEAKSPPVPDSDDGTKIQCPPADLPEENEEEG